MQFKHPEILYFLFLLVIPILVHLFQLRRFKTEYFTNVKFLKEIIVQTRKSSKIKKWLLLCTRLLLLTFLILAFAQPFFKAKDANAVTNEMFIVLDNSFSMQAKGQKGELLKRAVQDLLEHTPENTTFSLITNSEGYYNTDIKSIERELQNLKYSATPFQLDQIVSKIKASKSPYNKDIIVITDAVNLQQNQITGFDATTQPHFVIPKAEQKNNLAIDSVYINQTMDNFYEINLKIKAFGTFENEIPIAVYNQGKLIAKSQQRIDGKQKNVLFTIPKEAFQGYVTIEDGALEYDNTYYFSISKPNKINVISIGDQSKSTFLSKIYTPDEFTYQNFELKSLDYNSIEKQDAIVLNELKEIPQALQTTLQSFVFKGGNLIIIPGHEAVTTQYNQLLQPLGGIQLGPMVTTERKITQIAFSHPLYSGVFEKKIDNFQYPTSQSHYPLQSPFPAVLSYEDQSTFLTTTSKSIGSVYVFAAAINKDNTNFQNAPLIVPTFYNMAQNQGKSGLNAITIGNSQPVIITGSLSKDEIVSIENEQEKFIPLQQVMNDKVKLTFQDSPQSAGNYEVTKQGTLLQQISFNYPRTESDLFQGNDTILSDFTVDSSIESIFDTLQHNRTDNQLWKWFIYLTLAFLIIEICIQKFVK
jgi:hypothetical protein